MKSAQTFRTEFPDFPADSPAIVTLLARGFIDTSWHNDACPSFEAMGLRVWVDFPDADQRGMMGAQFGIVYGGEVSEGFSPEGLDESFEDFADVLAFLDGYATEFNALPEWARKPITSRAEAEDFMRAAHAAGKLWHLDDSPVNIVPAFSRAEIGALFGRREECFEFCEGDPHEYCIWLIRPASWAALDDALASRGYARLTREQRECADDPDRREECIDMLDDLQARVGIPADVVQAMVAELDGDWQ